MLRCTQVHAGVALNTLVNHYSRWSEGKWYTATSLHAPRREKPYPEGMRDFECPVA